MNQPTTPAFKLGISMSGAATAGAYIGGAIDFLLEALREWQKAKDSGPTAPGAEYGWAVELTNLAGTSAGGITSTLTVGSLNIDFVPFKDIGTDVGNNNPIYKAWVEELTHQHLFDITDLESNPNTIQSIFNANFLQDIATSVLSTDATLNEMPPWAKEPLLTLTSTNLRGVPYKSVLNFEKPENQTVSPTMKQYADYTTFTATETPDNLDNTETYPLDVLDRQGAGWTQVVNCSKATAAYPLGFPAVLLETLPSMYNARPLGQPDWNSDFDSSIPFRYMAVDGGCLNNEPYEIVKRQMVNATEGQGFPSSMEGGGNAWGSVWLISPFASEKKDVAPSGETMSVLSVLTSLLPAALGQSNFNAGQVFTGKSSDFNLRSLSKMLIAPIPEVPNDERPVLATATLSGFGGILDKSIREHDYLLGRRNCQDFLRNTFVMSREDMAENEIFAPYLDNIAEIGNIPIIPLIGSANDTCRYPDWPSFSTDDIRAIRESIKDEVLMRADKMLDVVDQKLPIDLSGIKDIIEPLLAIKVPQIITGALDVFRQVDQS